METAGACSRGFDPATGGSGLGCAPAMLLEALVARAGVTLVGGDGDRRAAEIRHVTAERSRFSRHSWRQGNAGRLDRSACASMSTPMRRTSWISCLLNSGTAWSTRPSGTGRSVGRDKKGVRQVHLQSCLVPAKARYAPTVSFGNLQRRSAASTPRDHRRARGRRQKCGKLAFRGFDLGLLTPDRAPRPHGCQHHIAKPPCVHRRLFPSMTRYSSSRERARFARTADPARSGPRPTADPSRLSRPRSALLGEAVVLTTLLGSSPARRRFILQTQADGPVSFLIVDFQALTGLSYAVSTRHGSAMRRIPVRCSATAISP